MLKPVKNKLTVKACLYGMAPNKKEILYIFIGQLALGARKCFRLNP